jgi:hypothetical protein
MPVVVVAVVALMLPRIQRLMGPLPTGSATPHATGARALGHPQVGHPAAGRPLVLAHGPVRDAMAPHVRVRGLERHVMDKAPARPTTCGAVVSLILRDTPRVLRRLPLMAPQGLIACLDPQDGMPIVRVQGLNGGGPWRCDGLQ